MEQQKSAHKVSSQPANRNSESEHSNPDEPTIPHPGNNGNRPVEPNRTSNLFPLDGFRDNEMRPPSIHDEEDGMRPPSIGSVARREEHLPIAVPLRNDQNNHTQDENIIEGVIVNPATNKPKKRRLVESILAFATIVIIMIIIAIVKIKQSDPDEVEDVIQPTPSFFDAEIQLIRIRNFFERAIYTNIRRRSSKRSDFGSIFSMENFFIKFTEASWESFCI